MSFYKMEVNLFQVSFITTASFLLFIFIVQDAWSKSDISLEY